MPRLRQVGSLFGKVDRAGDTMTGGLTGTTLNMSGEISGTTLNMSGEISGTTLSMSGEVSGATINNQFSNMLAAQLLDISSTLKFLNTLTGAPVTDAANMIDVSGAAHNGTYKGTWAAAQRVAKGFGWMLSPNGTDNYVNLGDSDDFSFGDGTNDVAFTIAGMVEVTDTATTRTIIGRWNTSTPLREWLVLLQSAEKVIVYFYDESSDKIVNRVTDVPLSIGFHTCVITYSGVGGATAANGITIYVDGAVVASTATNNADYVAMENLALDTTIGCNYSGGVFVDFMVSDFTPPIVDKGTVWTAAQVNRFHQLMKGVFNL